MVQVPVSVRRRTWVTDRVRVCFSVRARFRLRIRIRVRFRVSLGVRVRVRVRDRLFIKPLPLSRYHSAYKGILFGVQAWRRV